MTDEENELWIDRMFPTMKRGDPQRPKFPSSNERMLQRLKEITAPLELASVSDAEAAYVGIYFANENEAREFVQAVKELQAIKKGEAK
jgi:hypothetical protein